jgi:DNA-binding transcriptional ArsR family regulator
MPRLIQPNHPQEVEAAIEVLGNRAHAAILRYLHQKGPCTTGEILNGIILNGNKKLTRPSLQHHLEALEATGAVTVDFPVGQRHGKRVKYEANIDAVEFELLPAYVNYLRGK